MVVKKPAWTGWILEAQGTNLSLFGRKFSDI
jgi:hypothetical protein